MRVLEAAKLLTAISDGHDGEVIQSIGGGYGFGSLFGCAQTTTAAFMSMVPANANWGTTISASAIDEKHMRKWGWKIKPSILAPRWTSRITLEITGIRVERLHEISDRDILREGFSGGGPPGRRKQFIDLWVKLNGKDAWDANPWLWVIEFKRV